MKDMKNIPQKPSYEELLSSYESLKKSYEELKEAERLSQEKIQCLLKYIYGRKAEQKSQIDQDGFHQTSLFDEVDVTEEIRKLDEAVEKIRVSGYEKKARKRNSLTGTGLPETVAVHRAEVPAGTAKVQEIGYDETRHLVYVPAHAYIMIDRYQVIKCFDGKGGEVIVTAKRSEAEMLKGSIASPELVAGIIHDKFVMHSPLYRQEEEFRRKGIELSRMDMSNYVSKFARWAKPLHAMIADHIRKADNVRADETTLNVIEINGTKARLERNGKSKSYVWMFATAEGHERALDYVLGPGRDYAVPAQYFPRLSEGRFLQSDGYEAYSCAQNSGLWTNIPCMAHIRRKFAEIVQLDPKLATDGAKKSESVLGYIGLIYKTDRSIRETCGNDYEKIKEERERTLRPMFETLFGTCEKLASSALPKGKFAAALNYAINRKAGMMNLFLDGRLTLDNNYAEREGIKDLVIGRKNWLFANTKAGAEVTCEVFSIVQTAMANGLDPYKYIVWLINELPQPSMLGFDYSKYLPWSDSIPEDIRQKQR